MKLNQLKPATGAKQSRRRVGRGLGSGRGKTAGRGTKGQLSRSGYSKSPSWEGGRSRLFARLPKRGFNNNRYREEYQIINLADLNVLATGTEVTLDSLKAHGIVRHENRPVKLLGNGELEVNGLVVELDNYSRSAISAIEAKGGTVKNKKTEADKPSGE